MGILADWQRERERKRVIAEIKQREQRYLILEWYKLLKPFHTGHQRHGDGKHAQLMALADDLSKNAISDLICPSIFYCGLWTVILVLIILFDSKPQWAWLVGPLGYIGIIALAFHMMRIKMRRRLENYAEGWWVVHDPATGKQIYFGERGSSLLTCPQCTKNNYSDHYLRYLELVNGVDTKSIGKQRSNRRNHLR
jgi:hypothetical protein